MRSAVGYFYPYTDLLGGWQAIRQGTLTPWSWARSWPGAYQPLFAWDDPLPAAFASLDFARRTLRARSIPATSLLGRGQSLYPARALTGTLVLLGADAAHERDEGQDGQEDQ